MQSQSICIVKVVELLGCPTAKPPVTTAALILNQITVKLCLLSSQIAYSCLDDRVLLQEIGIVRNLLLDLYHAVSTLQSNSKRRSHLR